jgi:excisionase family DNA binding protein
MNIGRPLRPEPRRTSTGTWSVEVPVTRGGRKRMRRTFTTEAEARSWMTVAVDAIEAGRRVPEPGAPSEEPDDRTGFAVVAEAWIHERYVALNRAQPGRRPDVEGMTRNHLVPFMERHGFTTGSDITRDAYVAFLSELARGTGPAATASPGAVGGEVTIEEACALTGASRSTMKRRIADGAFPSSHIAGDGKRRIPVADLAAAGLLNGEAMRRGPKTAHGYAPDRVADIRRCLDKILAHGVATAGWVVRFDPASVPNPRPAVPEADRKQLTLADCLAMAPFLHPVHQVALWVIRLLSLRISEAYGLRIDDVIETGARGLVHIRRQGGGVFLVDGADGVPRSSSTKSTLKTATSDRLLVVPRPLMDLIRATVEVFHTDTDGRVRAYARLIPGLTEADEGGQNAFRTALRRAALAAGVTVGDDEELETALLPVPKDMRSGTITDLAWNAVPELVRKRWAGHAAGSDVHAKHYVLDHPDIKALLPATKAIE